MKVYIELYKPSKECKDGFLYTLFINDLFICSLHNLDIVKEHIKKEWYNIMKMEN